MINRFDNDETWVKIPQDRRNALLKCFGLYKVSNIPKEMVQQLDEYESFRYQYGKCHQNSILFAEHFKGRLQCFLVEGIAINSRGEAFMHYWNKFQSITDENGNTEEQNDEYDITHDLLMPQEGPFLYFKIKEYNIDDFKVGQTMEFSELTKNKLEEYLSMVPNAKPLL